MAIASAICAKKDILFYDEPTSGLDRSGMENFGRLLNETIDADNESQIQAALFKLCEGKTTMVIAHRLNTIKKADKILVLDKGQILQEGRHEELMKVDGAYRNMILAGGMEDE